MTAHVIPYGCGQILDTEADQFLRRGPLPKSNYLLYIGAIDERKDIPTAIAAFTLARPDLPKGFRLVIAGPRRERFGKGLESAILELPPSAGVEVRHVVDRATAIDLISRAATLVFPSRAEGFGLPILEALATGTSVVASDLPEIRSWANSSVSYITPGDPDGMAEAIIESVRDGEELAREGQHYAADYRWRRFAESTVAFATGVDV